MKELYGSEIVYILIIETLCRLNRINVIIIGLKMFHIIYDYSRQSGLIQLHKTMLRDCIVFKALDRQDEG